MANKLILTGIVAGLIGGASFLALAPAQDKGPVKTPGPIRPLPPAKPQTPVKPAPTESSVAPLPTQLTAPMSADAIQRALAKKIELDLTAVPLSDAVAAIKRQTNLEIRISPDALSMKDDDKSAAKTGDIPAKPAEKAPDKSTEKPSDTPAEKPAEKPTVKPAEKPAEKAPDKAPDKAPAKAPAASTDKGAGKNTEKSAVRNAEKLTEKAPEKIADKPADAAVETAASTEPVVSAHLKGISAASALDLVLRDVGLSWSIDHGGIFVAPPDQLPATTAVYDVRDLVVAHPSFDSHDDSVEFQYDPLIGLITGVIQCPGWAGDVDKIQDCNPFHGTLTVRQDQQVQQKVAGLLAALRKARDLPTFQFGRSASAGWNIVGGDDSAVAAALDAHVETAFNGAKLDQVVEWIRRTFGIPVHVDAAVSAAMRNNASFTLKASGVSLKAMLNALLPQARLAYTVTDETLLISTQDAVADLRSIRVYPVGDLIGGEIDAHGIDDDYAQLLDSITHNIQPDSWAALDRQKATGSSGNAYAAYLPAGRALVVDQTNAAHEEIAAVLAKLRAAVASQPAAVKPLAGLPAAGKTDTGAAQPTKRYLSMRIYKLNPDLPADDFVAVVRDLVEPKDWSGDAYIHGVPGAIVVKQSPAVHKRIERLLIELGAMPDPKKSGAGGTPILIGGRKRA